MKTYSSGWKAVLANGGANDVGAVEVLCSPPVRAWGGFDPLVLDGETYTPLGAKGMVRVNSAALGGAENAVELRLSGIDPDVLALLDADAVRGAPVRVWRLGFSDAGELLDAQVFERGKIDLVVRDETAGGDASLTSTVMSAARGSGRSTGRQRADADQRLVSATDGGMRRVTLAGDLELAWGGKPPNRAGSALPGVGAYGGRPIGPDVQIV